MKREDSPAAYQTLPTGVEGYLCNKSTVSRAVSSFFPPIGPLVRTSLGRNPFSPR